MNKENLEKVSLLWEKHREKELNEMLEKSAFPNFYGLPKLTTSFLTTSPSKKENEDKMNETPSSDSQNTP